MHISLTPQLESRVRAKVESGLYKMPVKSSARRCASWALTEEWIREIKLAQLRKQLKVDAQQLDRGEGIPIDSETALDALFDGIMR